MKYFTLLCMATIFAQQIVAQKIEPIPSNEQSLFWQIPMTQRINWIEKAFTPPEGMYKPLAFLPDTLHAGERFDLYFTCDPDMGEGTFELYRIEGKRKKRILRKNFIPAAKGIFSFAFMLWVTIDEPGRYAFKAYQNKALMEFPDKEIAEITFDILPKPTTPHRATP